MHGTNQLRPRESKPGFLQVQDIWPTIQGEGPFSGMPAIFVRLTGCHLACTFCDTQWDDNKDPYLPVYSRNYTHPHHKDIVHYESGVLERIHNINYKKDKLFEHKLVVLTGGEPCRQDLGTLIEDLTEGGSDSYIVQIETAGTFWQDCLANPKVTIVCSPKTKVVHPKIMEHCNHWKYVIQANRISILDGLPAGSTQTVTKEMIKGFVAPDLYQNVVEKNPGQLEPFGLLHIITGSAKFGSPARPPQREGVTVWLSPCNEYDPVKDEQNLRAARDSCIKHGYRAMVQLHRHLDVP